MAEAQQLVLRRIYEHLIDGTHNDLQLVFQDGSMTASKICITALSPYFEAMLTSDMLERKTGVITFPTISSTIFLNILKCYFLGENVVNELNCFPLLEAAEMMQLDHLKSLCLYYLNNNLSLTTENCVDIWRSLKKFDFEDLATKTFQYMVKHVERLSEKGSTLSLTKSEYIELFSQDHLLLDEDDVLRDVLTWINTNNPSVETMIDLFKVVRFEHVSLTYVTNDAIFSNMVKEHEDLQQLVHEGLTRRSQKYNETCTFSDSRLSKVDVMFVLNNSFVLSAACTTDNTWYELPPAPYEPGFWAAGAVLKKHIYITGGRAGDTSSMIYDVWRKTWEVGPHLKHSRLSHCMAATDNKVYVIGGLYSNTIEQLQHGQTDWQVVGDLGCKREDSCAEAVGENILVMGGTANDLVLTHLQCFNTSTHAVSTISTHERSGYVTRSYLKMPNLYLLHSDGAVDLVTVDESNTPTLTTKRVVQTNGCEHYFGFVYTDGCILVVTEDGLWKMNFSDGSKESIKLQNTPTLGVVHGTINMHVPRLCLQ